MIIGSSNSLKLLLDMECLKMKSAYSRTLQAGNSRQCLSDLVQTTCLWRWSFTLSVEGVLSEKPLSATLFVCQLTDLPTCGNVS